MTSQSATLADGSASAGGSAGIRPPEPPAVADLPARAPAGLLPAARAAPVRVRTRQHHRRHQAQPGDQPGWLPGPRAHLVGSAAVRRAAEPDGRVPVPDGAVLRPRQARGDAVVGDPAALDRGRAGGRVLRDGAARGQAGDRDAMDAGGGRLRLCPVAHRTQHGRRTVGRVPADGDAALDPAAAGRCGLWYHGPGACRGPVGGGGRVVQRYQRRVDRRRAGTRGHLPADGI